MVSLCDTITNSMHIIKSSQYIHNYMELGSAKYSTVHPLASYWLCSSVAKSSPGASLDANATIMQSRIKPNRILRYRLENDPCINRLLYHVISGESEAKTIFYWKVC